MAEYGVQEVSEHRHEHYAVTEDGRPIAYTNNGEDARLVMFALAIADTAVKADQLPPCIVGEHLWFAGPKGPYCGKCKVPKP